MVLVILVFQELKNQITSEESKPIDPCTLARDH